MSSPANFDNGRRYALYRTRPNREIQILCFIAVLMFAVVCRRHTLNQWIGLRANSKNAPLFRAWSGDDSPSRSVDKPPAFLVKDRISAAVSPNRYRQHLLGAVPAGDCIRIALHLDLLPMNPGDALYESGDKFGHAVSLATHTVNCGAGGTNDIALANIRNREALASSACAG